MPLRPVAEKRPLLRERYEAEKTAEGWLMAAGWSAFASGGVALVLPGLALMTGAIVPISLTFAYVFKKRKAACDMIIDDPPRNDFRVATRPQRTWFDPLRLSGMLSPAQLRLADLMTDADAYLRAAVRADERAQGAYRRSVVASADWQGSLSDQYFDDFVRLLPRISDVVAEVANEVRAAGERITFEASVESERRIEDFRSAMSSEDRNLLASAGITETVLESLAPPSYERRTDNAMLLLADDLDDYGRGVRERSTRLKEASSQRSPLRERLRQFD